MLVRITPTQGYDGERLDELVGYLLGEQLNDGGWNCAAHGDLGKHAGAACPGLVERNRLSCWLRPARLAPCVMW
jgi:hypothetical protein